MTGLRPLLRDFGAALVAFGAIWGTGLFSQAMSPFLVGTLISDGHIDAQHAGLIQSVELFAIAVTSLLLTTAIERLPRRTLALCGALLAAAMHLLSTTTRQPELLLAIRAVAGIGAGLVLTAGNAFIAEAAEPERLFGRMCAVTAVFFAAIFSALGFIAERYGMRGTYGFEGVWVLLMLLLIVRLPKTGTTAATREVRHGAPSAVLTGMILGGTLLFAICDVGVWSFSERVANSIGVTTRDSGLAMAASSVTGMMGALVVVAIGRRFGAVWPLLLGLTLFGCTCFAVMTARAPWVYLTAMVVYQAVYTFTISYLYGTAADMDRSGRVIVATSGAALLGASIAPYAVGSLSRWVGFAPTGRYIVGILLVVIGMMAYLLVRVYGARATAQMLAGTALPSRDS